MKKSFLTTMLGLLGCASVWAQTSPLFINSSDLTTAVPPQVDATAFLNQALFSVTTTEMPFDTQNTLFFTNKGSGNMVGSVGFRFNFITNVISSTYGYYPADTFHNQGQISGNPYVLVDATNINNIGIIQTGPGGLIQLKGQNVNLSRSGIRSGADLQFSSYFGYDRGGTVRIGTNNYYYHPSGVTDYYWAVGKNNELGTNGNGMTFGNASGTNFPVYGGFNFDLPNPYSPYHEVIQMLGATTYYTNVTQVPYFFSSGQYSAFAFTNVISANDTIVQVVFAPTNTPAGTNLGVAVRFGDIYSGYFGYSAGASVPIVEFSSVDHDVVLQKSVTNFVYLLDYSATATNFSLLNVVDGATYTQTRRRHPNVHEIALSTPFEWAYSSPANTYFTNSLFYNTSLATNTVDISYAASSVMVRATNQSYMVTPVFGQVVNTALTDPTNLVGRIEIIADKLDISQTRIRSENLVSIKAKNLVGNQLATVDAPIINYDLGSTNMMLTISNLVAPTVNRLSGSLSTYSAIWTNYNYSLSTNYTFGTNGLVTNIVTLTNLIKFHVLIVEPSFTTTKPVLLNEFAAHATNLTIFDNLVVGKSLQIDARGLRLATNGNNVAGLNLPGTMDWSTIGFPNLLNLTNDGRILIPRSGYFYGPNDTNGLATPYGYLINSGSITGASHFVIASNLVHSGMWVASSGVMSLGMQEGAIINGRLQARSDVSISANNLVFSNSSIWAGSQTAGALSLTVTNFLGDGGAGDKNDWAVSDGFQLWRHPASGDLLGTKLTSTAAQFAQVNHVWAGVDHGATAAGFSNNTALGRLVLDGASSTLFVFSGATSNNALYADYIELRNNATNINSSVFQIDPTITIYFANANLPVGKLNNALGGRFRWVPSYAGVASTTNLNIAPGVMQAFNSALLQSADYDSDRDGIVNRFDPTPVFTSYQVDLTVTVSAVPALVSSLSWVAPAGATNQVEYMDILSQGGWRPLTNFVQSATGRTSISDTPSGSGPRFYRVRVESMFP